MADPLYVNPNICRTFTQVISTVTVAISSNQVCGEAYIVNKTGGNVFIYDNGYSDAEYGFLLEDNDSATFHGITNLTAISAATSSGSGTIYIRAKYYSHNPSR